MIELAFFLPSMDPALLRLHLGSLELTLRWYALAYLVGLFWGRWYLGWLCARPALWPQDNPPLRHDSLDDLLFAMVLGVIVGGRLGFVLLYAPLHYLADPLDIFRVWKGGMSFHGGLLGVFISLWFYARKLGISVLSLADGIAATVPLGLLLGRLANFVNGELWGRVTSVPWGVVFFHDPQRLVRHPSQLYEAALEGIFLLVILALAIRLKALKFPGTVSGLFLLLYALVRISVEFFREPDLGKGYVAHWIGIGISAGQLFSVPMIFAGLSLLWRAFNLQRRHLW